MSGYIGSRASVVSSGAERKQIVNVTTTTTSISGVSYIPGFVDVFHNGIRLVQDTDFTATDGTTITLTNSAENGDQIVIKTNATFSPADAVSKGGDSMSGALSLPAGGLTVGTDQLVVDSSGRVTMSQQPAIYLNGNFPNQVNFSGGQQLLVSSYYNQIYSRNMTWNSSTGTITVPISGLYMVSFSGYEVGAGGRVEININDIGEQLVQWGFGTNGISFITPMNANDYFTVTASSFDLPQLFMGDQYTYFSSYLIG